LFAIGVLTPLIKENEEVAVITITLNMAMIEILFINQGSTDE